MNNKISRKEMRTPIEVFLEMDENNMVSAKKLYEFLELAPQNYARWCKENIVENPIIIEGEDFIFAGNSMVNSFPHNEENPLVGGRPSQDYLLTIDFAKELCMTCKTKKGKQARDYFKKTEKALVVTIKQYNELVAKLNTYEKRLENVTQDMANLRIESDKVSDFTKRNEPYFQKIIDHYLNSPAPFLRVCADKDFVTDAVIHLMEQMDAKFKYSWAENEYRATYNRDVPSHKYSVIDCLPEYQLLFTLALIKLLDKLEEK